MLLYMLAIWKGFEWCLQPPVMKKEKKMNIGDLSQFECFALMWNVFKWSSIISRFTKDYILKTCLKPMMWKGFERMRGFQKVLATANWNLNIGFGSSWMWLMVMMVKNFHQNWQSCSYMVIVYLMLMFVYPLSDADIYRLSNAWCNQVVYALCGEYVCVWTRYKYWLLQSEGAPCTHALTLSYKYNAALSKWSAVHKQYRKSFELTFHFSKPVCPYWCLFW